MTDTPDDLTAAIFKLRVRPPLTLDVNSRGVRLAYRTGHRDARHAAAELAAIWQARIEQQAAEIARLRGGLQAALALMPDDEGPEVEDARAALRGE